MSNQLVIIPRLSEKTYAQSKSRTYVFDVAPSVNKNQIAAAVAKQYGVTVTAVNTTIAKGKAKRTAVNGGRSFYNGKRNDVKKAYVTLAEGQSIKLFEEEQ